MISPRFSEQVEYLFNYAPEELAMWTRHTFFGSAPRGFITSSFLLLSVVGVAAFLIDRSRSNEVK